MSEPQRSWGVAAYGGEVLSRSVGGGGWPLCCRACMLCSPGDGHTNKGQRLWKFGISNPCVTVLQR